MRKLLFVLILSLVAQQAHALDERSASRIVRNYSETVACQIDETTYKAFEIQQGDTELDGFGSLYVVNWQGDIGCAGGNGTVTENFSVVEHRGFISAEPIVVTDYNFPELPLVTITGLTVEAGLLRISGLRYGPDDRQHNPTQKVVYRVKFDGTEFAMD